MHQLRKRRRLNTCVKRPRPALTRALSNVVEDTEEALKLDEKNVKAYYRAATYKTVRATYKTVKAIYKTVKATYKTVEATFKTVKTTYKTVKA